MRACLILLMVAASSVAGEARSRPNVLLIVADDLGWRDLACYGSDLHETPHIDRLAAGGLRCTEAYAASPVCTPTRASLLTGKHPARLHMTIWREAALDRGTRQLLEPITRGDLPLSETTLAETLHAQGYYTAHIGKWHLGSATSYPQCHGYDVNIGGTLWGAPQSFFYPFRGDQYFRDWRYVPDLEPGKPGDYLTDRLTDKALEIINSRTQHPFFLSLCYYTVHTPIEGKPRVVRRFAERVRKGAVHTNPDYAAMVHSLDENVGRLLGKLDELKLTDNTIVLFLSDNGGFINDGRLHPGRPVTSNRPLRSGKGSLYEGGIRVPLIVRWPNVTPQGKVCSHAISTCDIYPTLLSGLEIDVPPGQTVDGINVLSYLKQPARDSSTRDLFFHYPHYYPTTTPVSAVRSDNWKLLEYFEDGRTELYDLARDVSEEHNIAAENPAVVSRLLGRLNSWRSSVEAQTPDPNPAWKAN